MFQVAFALCTLSEALTTPKALVLQGRPVYNALTEVQVSSPAYYLASGAYLERKISYFFFLPSFFTALIPLSKHVVHHCSVALVHPLLSSSKFYIASVQIQSMAQWTSCHGEENYERKTEIWIKHLNEVSVLNMFHTSEEGISMRHSTLPSWERFPSA